MNHFNTEDSSSTVLEWPELILRKFCDKMKKAITSGKLRTF